MDDDTTCTNEDKLMTNTAQLTAAMEDYLEAIYHLQHEERVARVKDIARRLNVQMPSVSRALDALAQRKLVRHEKYGYVTLTRDGLAKAEQVYLRHQALARFLSDILQVDEKQAEAEACELEHALSAETLKRLIGLIDFVKRCPRGGQQWLRHLSGRWEDVLCEYDCAQCVADIEIPKQHPFKPIEGSDEQMMLDQLTPGERGKVARVKGDSAVRRRIMDMGVTPGSDVEVERVAPFGDPIEVRVRGYHLSLRKEEAAQIAVERE